MDRSGTFTTIDVPGATSTFVNGVSDHGQIVGQYRLTTTGIDHGFTERGGTFATIDVPGAAFTQAIGVSDRGQIVGTSDNHGFEFSPRG
jgi:uncharacterized membrane protein